MYTTHTRLGQWQHVHIVCVEEVVWFVAIKCRTQQCFCWGWHARTHTRTHTRAHTHKDLQFAHRHAHKVCGIIISFGRIYITLMKVLWYNSCWRSFQNYHALEDVNDCWPTVAGQNLTAAQNSSSVIYSICLLCFETLVFILNLMQFSPYQPILAPWAQTLVLLGDDR